MFHVPRPSKVQMEMVFTIFVCVAFSGGIWRFWRVYVMWQTQNSLVNMQKAMEIQESH